MMLTWVNRWLAHAVEPVGSKSVAIPRSTIGSPLWTGARFGACWAMVGVLARPTPEASNLQHAWGEAWPVVKRLPTSLLQRLALARLRSAARASRIVCRKKSSIVFIVTAFSFYAASQSSYALTLISSVYCDSIDCAILGPAKQCAQSSHFVLPTVL